MKEAHSLVVIKKYPNVFQKLEYKIGAPLQALRSYSDSGLAILQGPYYEYNLNGNLSKSGYYNANKKDSIWYNYNDTGKVTAIEKFEMGFLIKAINPDTIKKEEKNNYQDITYKKARGNKDWIHYLLHSINGDVASNSVKGGTVWVGFAINKGGKCINIHLRRSAEFVLDEEALRTLENAPPWQLDNQEMEDPDVYRVQAITFVKQ